VCLTVLGCFLATSVSWFTNLPDPLVRQLFLFSLDLTYQTTCRLDATPKTTVSKTDFSDVLLVARKTQQVASWLRDGVSRGEFETLVVTRSACDHVKSEIKVTLQRVSFISD